MRQKLVRLAVLILTLSSAPAGADDKEQAKKLVEQAEVEYKLGRFQQSLDLYTRAYETYKAPGLFFNIGQCHFRLQNWERAAFFYEAYLREKPNAPNRATVEELIQDARREQKKLESSQRTAEERQRAEAERTRLAEQRRLEEERRASAEAQARLVAEQNEAAERAEPKPIYKKWWFWTGVALVAAAATGATLYYLSGETTYTACAMPDECTLGSIRAGE